MKRLYKARFLFILCLSVSSFVLIGCGDDDTKASVKITYLGNDGVLITDGDKAVIIDGLHANPSAWVQLSTVEYNKLLNAQPPYNNVDVVMSTHDHSDHSSPTNIDTFLSESPQKTKFIGPPQVNSGLNDQSQIIGINPTFRTKEETTVNGITIEVFHLKHFDQFGYDFSDVENFGYLVHIGGLKILHLGDVEYSVENFQNFNLENEGIDVVLIPTFNALISSTNRDLINSLVSPKNVIALHFQTSQLNDETSRVASLFQNVTLFTIALQTKDY